MTNLSLKIQLYRSALFETLEFWLTFIWNLRGVNNWNSFTIKQSDVGTWSSRLILVQTSGDFWPKETLDVVEGLVKSEWNFVKLLFPRWMNELRNWLNCWIHGCNLVWNNAVWCSLLFHPYFIIPVPLNSAKICFWLTIYSSSKCHSSCHEKRGHGWSMCSCVVPSILAWEMVKYYTVLVVMWCFQWILLFQVNFLVFCP